MGVNSDGNSYGIPEGLIFSFPVTIGADRNWKIVEGLNINDFAREKLEITAKVGASNVLIGQSLTMSFHTFSTFLLFSSLTVCQFNPQCFYCRSLARKRQWQKLLVQHDTMLQNHTCRLHDSHMTCDVMTGVCFTVTSILVLLRITFL